MKVFHTEITIGDETVSVAATYRWTPVLPETDTDPESGGVELHSVMIEWTDQPWVDRLIGKIYEEETEA